MSLGTRLFTMFNGKLVGTDEFGNKYYCSPKKKHDRHGRQRRWVMYNGMPEASKVPPEWHAWLHHTVDEPLTEEAAQAKPWQKRHLPNLTGTKGAYRPSGHDTLGGQRASTSGDYQAWEPN